MRRFLLALPFIAISFVAFRIGTTPNHAPPLWLQADKCEHAFFGYLITLSAYVAVPKVRIRWVLLGLAGAAAALEVVQGIAVENGDPSFYDWLGSVSGIILAFTPMVIKRWRQA